MKKLLFIADPLSSFVVKKDSTLAMMKASQQRGHEVWHCHIHDLKSIDSLAQADCKQIAIIAHDGSRLGFSLSRDEIEQNMHVMYLREKPLLDKIK